MVTADGAGVVSHAGSRLLADLADATTLTGELAVALDGVRGSRPRRDPGRVLVDLAMGIADAAEAISNIVILADQPALLGSVASDSTCFAGDRAAKPLWLWTSDPAATGVDVDRAWRAFLRRFDLEHTFRFFKQALGWTTPKLRDPRPPTAGPGWSSSPTPSCA
jgi:hypothetical protein